jgi:hypothetical protein
LALLYEYLFHDSLWRYGVQSPLNLILPLAVNRCLCFPNTLSDNDAYASVHSSVFIFKLPNMIAMSLSFQQANLSGRLVGNISLAINILINININLDGNININLVNQYLAINIT